MSPTFARIMPHSMPAPDYLFGPGGKLLPEIMTWSHAELKGEWVGVYAFWGGEHHVDFEFANDLILFKLRWVGS